MTLVVGTAGHIDHGKTTLLRALTGIDADRLPEERRRGMTIDVGYAHLALDDGTVIDFVDVPGHDRLIGNMLVGAGEMDLAMLVVAADDRPRAQTLEHLGLLRALSLDPALAVVTKIDVVDADRLEAVTAAVRELVGVDVPVIAASGVTGAGIPDVRNALAAAAAAVIPADRPPSLAIDRVFTVKGRGAVVTGTLRGGPLARGDVLRLVPGEATARIREIQVRGGVQERVPDGGRTALNLAGVETAALARGAVLTADRSVVATDRLLMAFAVGQAPPDRSRWRLHLGTAAIDATVGRGGHDALNAAGVVRLAALIAARPGDRGLLRRGGSEPVGVTVLDAAPPRGLSRRRQSAERVAALADGGVAARLELHGALVTDGRVTMAGDVSDLAAGALEALTASGPTTLAVARAAVARTIRRQVTLRRDDAIHAASDVIHRLVADGTLVRDRESLRRTGEAPAVISPLLEAAMTRLESVLDVPAPPPLADAARLAGCPPTGIRALERASRIVLLEPDLAYAMPTYQRLAANAIELAGRTPLTPSAFRHATGTSRKYVMAILEDLDRRGLLRRTPAGHVPGPRAPRISRVPGA